MNDICPFTKETCTQYCKFYCSKEKDCLVKTACKIIIDREDKIDAIASDVSAIYLSK